MDDGDEYRWSRCGLVRVGTRGVRLLISAVIAVGAGLLILVGDLQWQSILAVAGVGLAGVLSRMPRATAAGWILTGVAAGYLVAPNASLALVGDGMAAGSITVGLCLGHWFLVDPHLPRGPMRALALGAILGLLATAVGTIREGSAGGTIGPLLVWIVVASGVISALALGGAIAALNVPTYKGVQSATGLFYICTMSAAGYIILAASLRVPV